MQLCCNTVLCVQSDTMAFHRAIILSCYCLFLLGQTVKCSPPGPVVGCSNGLTNCTVLNAYAVFPYRRTCRAGNVIYPSTEKELLASVAEAVKKNLSMRVVTRYSHSIPNLLCPRGEFGLIISTRDLNHVASVDETNHRMTFESGVTLKDLLDAAAKKGLALPHSPYWLGVTLGGMLGTGAHGSSLIGKGGAVHEYVVGMSLVVPASQSDGYAKIVNFTEADDDLNAVKVSLGVLGVISQVTLQLQPMFKRSVTRVEKDDSDLENSIVEFGKEHEFADVTWYPAMRKVLYRVDDRVSVTSDGDGVNDFIGFQPTSKGIITYFRKAEERAEAHNNAEEKCKLSKLSFYWCSESGFGLKNDGHKFSGYPVIGYQNNLQSSGSCLNSTEDAACSWDPRIEGLVYFQNAISINISKIGEFISDVKKLRDMIPGKGSLCGVELYNGFLMRYVKASTAYLGKEEDSVDIEMTYYRAKDKKTPRLYEDVLEEIEQMASIKYGALPHWGKNRNILFDGVMKKYKKYDAFLATKKKYDPEGLFSNEWTDSVLGIGEAGVVIEEDGCALEGLCVCSHDAHCAPEKGYLCKNGRFYKEARVCRRREDLDDGTGNLHMEL